VPVHVDNKQRAGGCLLALLVLAKAITIILRHAAGPDNRIIGIGTIIYNIGKFPTILF
jgi:hypothetical protein